MEIFAFRSGSPRVDEGFSVEDLPKLLKEKDSVIWIDMEAPGEEDDRLLADVFHFHPVTIEDARETRNQPKVEPFPDYLFFILHGVKVAETNAANFVTKELDGYLGSNYVLTYHHEPFFSIDAVKKQLRS